MKFGKSIKDFVEKYPPKYFIKLLKRIIDKMINSITNSGKSIWRFLWIFPLLICILILEILLVIKFVFKKFFEIIKFILRFIRKLIITLLEELEFYWYKFKNTSGELLMFLKITNTKLIEVIKLQASKLGDKNFKPSLKNKEYSFLKLVFNITKNLILTIIWFVFGTIMSVILLVSTFILYPFLHQWFRIRVLKANVKEEG